MTTLAYFIFFDQK
jgi:hypothetical protein